MYKIFRIFLGSNNLRSAGVGRAWRGMRQGDRRELYLGLALAALSWIRQSKPGKELIYKKEVRKDSAIVIHHRRKGDPKIEVIKPQTR